LNTLPQRIDRIANKPDIYMGLSSPSIDGVTVNVVEGQMEKEPVGSKLMRWPRKEPQRRIWKEGRTAVGRRRRRSEQLPDTIDSGLSFT
jgi:hypothetical protein